LNQIKYQFKIKIGIKWAYVELDIEWGNSLLSLWFLADLSGWSATLGLKHGPTSF
jgi:hypothetical protein